MELRDRTLWCCTLLLTVIPIAGLAQAVAWVPPETRPIYERLLAQIEEMPIFDHHAHPGFASDPDVDAMAAPASFTSAHRVRSSNMELVAAAKALFDYPYDDLSPEHVKWLVSRKEALQQSQGAEYFSNILDTMNIERSLANRALMADYLDPTRFPWVFFGDAFMWAFNNERDLNRNTDQEVYIPLQEKMLMRYLQRSGLNKLPKELDEYLEFVSETMTRNKRDGGIAMKFELPYFRSTNVGDPSRQDIEDVYSRFAGGGVPGQSEYRAFQDYIFRYLVLEAGRLGLPVHIHSSVGIGDFFSLTESNIFNLENVLRDPRYVQTTFVLIHGGYPREREAMWLAAAKNVYLDSSMLELLLYPTEFKSVLRMWLETLPEKIVFGTDVFPYNEALGVEEGYWLGVVSARSALAAALAEMVSDRQLTERDAIRLARGFLHDNALAIYDKKLRPQVDH